MNGNRKAYFEDYDQNASINKTTFKKSSKKESNLIDIFNSRKEKQAQMTFREQLENRLKEAKRTGASEFQIMNLKNQLDEEILNEKLQMIENTETLSELSQTIDEIHHGHIYPLTNTAIYSSLKLQEIPEDPIDMHLSKIEEQNETIEKLNTDLNPTQEEDDYDITMQYDNEQHIVANPNKSLNKSGFVMMSPQAETYRQRVNTIASLDENDMSNE